MTGNVRREFDVGRMVNTPHTSPLPCAAVGLGHRRRKGRRLRRRWLRRRWLRGWLVGVAMGFSSIALAAAGDEGHEIRRAVAAGEVIAIERLFARIHEDFEGWIVKAELEREKRGGAKSWVYEIKLLTPQGNVLKLQYDARTMELLKVKGRHKPKEDHREDD